VAAQVIAVLSPSAVAFELWCSDNGYAMDRGGQEATKGDSTAIRVTEIEDLADTVIDGIDYAPGWWHDHPDAERAMLVDVEARAHVRRYG
jgi:hypothetical protein